jgi:hypothetical protein
MPERRLGPASESCNLLKVIGFYQLSGVKRPDPLVTIDEGRICLRTASTQRLDLVESVRIFV